MSYYPDLTRLSSMPGSKVKEQCEALFPYKALNDDELSLNEGQIVNIVSKDVEDKGWWKGEVNGRVGVFPDNFVKLIEPKQEEASVPVTTKPVSKKPTRPPAIATPLKDDLKKAKPSAVGGTSFRKNSASSNDSRSSSASKEKLNNSNSNSQNNSAENVSRVANRVSAFSGANVPKDRTKLNGRDNLVVSTVSTKRHSFGKSTPPPKPKPQAPSKPSSAAAVTSSPSKSSSSTAGVSKLVSSKYGMKSSSASNVLPEVVPSVQVESSVRSSLPAQGSMDVIDLDSVGVAAAGQKLSHPTAGRAKAPKRRPPSSVFVKDSKTNEDAFEMIKDEIKEQPPRMSRESSQEVSSVKLRATSSSEQLNKSTDSLKSSDSSEFASLTKSRLSFKKNIKDLFGGLSNGGGDKSNKEDSVASKKPPPPRPPLPTGGSQSEIVVPKADEPKRPGWLQELKRNQQNRKSGLFQQQESEDGSSERKKSLPPSREDSIVSPSTPSAPSVPAVVTQQPPVEVKPVLPFKPSQIKDDVRKSIQLPLTNKATPATTHSSSFRRSSLERDSPSVSEPIKVTKAEPVTSPVSVLSKPVVVAAVVAPAVVAEAVSAMSEKEEKKLLRKEKKKEKEAAALEELSMLERIRRLEKLVVDMQTGFDAEVSRLNEELRDERSARRSLEGELKKVAKR